MSDRTNRLEEVFQHAADLSASERSAYLDVACAGEAHLRTEVEELLSEFDDGTRGLLASPHSADAAAAALLDSANPAPIPERIGEFRIIRLLGEGGMGRVYESEQQSPRRLVALKVIRPGLMTRSVLRRFQHEVEILAGLKHPGIAQIYQAGVARLAETGLIDVPYFAMELVRGESLTAFVRRSSLDVKGKLELLAQICDAVQHAHQRGVIHRDLKPGNILVEDGSTKVLDFGIARLAQQDTSHATMQTELGQIVGTLAYMAPEQVEGDPRHLDTRADVYALGVITYELLAGVPPVDVSGKTIAEAARLIREFEPRHLGSITPALRGDIEVIVAKALDKDPQRRYASAGELAADIRRHLTDQPITARPATTLYQIRKLVRRNKGPAAGVAIAAMALVSGATISVWQAVEATRQRDAARDAQRAAERSQKRAEGVRDFLIEDVFGRLQISRGGGNTPAAQLLKDAGPQIETRFKDDPEVRATVESMLSVLLSNAGEFDESIARVKEAIRLHSQVFGPDSPQVATDQANYILVLVNAYRTDDVLKETPAIRERVERILGPASSSALEMRCAECAALLQNNRGREALAVILPAIENVRGTSTQKQVAFVYALNQAMASYRAIGDLDKALEFSQQCVDWTDVNQPPDSEHRVSCRMAHASLLGTRGRFTEAEPLARECVAHAARTSTPGDPSLAISQSIYASILIQLDRYADARAQLEPALASLSDKLGAMNWEAQGVRRKLFRVYFMLEDWPAMQRYLDESYAVCTEGKPEKQHDPQAIEVHRLRAESLIAQNRLEQAQTELDTAERLATTHIKPEDRKHLDAAIACTRGRLLLRRGDVETARPLLERARDIHKAERSPYFPDVAWFAERELARLPQP